MLDLSALPVLADESDSHADVTIKFSELFFVHDSR
jgi:hypothetical protein